MAAKKLKCSFCGKPAAEVRVLVRAPGGDCICDFCVKSGVLAAQLMDEDPEPPKTARVVDFAHAAAQRAPR